MKKKSEREKNTDCVSENISPECYYMYSVFLWIPPTSFHYPEILKAPEVNVLKLHEKLTSVAFFRTYITKLGEYKETHFIIPCHGTYTKGRRSA